MHTFNVFINYIINYLLIINDGIIIIKNNLVIHKHKYTHTYIYYLYIYIYYICIYFVNT